MQDPFPDEDKTEDYIKVLPKDCDDMVYTDCRFCKGDSPKCIYFPSRYVMFKLMRACIDVYAKQDLWFKHEDIEQ